MRECLPGKFDHLLDEEAGSPADDHAGTLLNASPPERTAAAEALVLYVPGLSQLDEEASAVLQPSERPASATELEAIVSPHVSPQGPPPCAKSPWSGRHGEVGRTAPNEAAVGLCACRHGWGTATRLRNGDHSSCGHVDLQSDASLRFRPHFATSPLCPSPPSPKRRRVRETHRLLQVAVRFTHPTESSIVSGSEPRPEFLTAALPRAGPRRGPRPRRPPANCPGTCRRLGPWYDESTCAVPHCPGRTDGNGLY
jgi:hypothetical protein